MEQDIETLEELIDEYKSCAVIGLDMQVDVTFREKQCRALEHLIKAYKELEEENKIIKGNYYTLCVDIQMVTSELGFPEDTIIADEMVSMIKENYIPVSLVEETIEEYQNNMKLYENETHNIFNENNIRQEIITVLQELLEKRK